MRAREFILEAEVSDDELRARWGNLGPNIRNVVPRSATNLDPAPTLWQVWEVIEDILGKENVYISWPEYDDDDEDPEEIDSKMFYVFQKDKYFMYRPTKSSSPGGSIEVPNLYSTSAKDIAIAAHEAYHAYIDAKSPGWLGSNEKIVNRATENWLRKHLKGTQLWVALDAINVSRVSYGKHHMPTDKSDKYSQISGGSSTHQKHNIGKKTPGYRKPNPNKQK